MGDRAYWAVFEMLVRKQFEIFCSCFSHPHRSAWRTMLTRMQTLMRCSSGSATNTLPSTSGPGDTVIPCSGRGDCLNGTCLCDIRYAGDECTGFNLPYHAGVSSVFYFVAALSLIQLLICCAAEYQRSKLPSLVRAFRLTTQKFLYFFVFVAALLRGAYFTTPVSIA